MNRRSFLQVASQALAQRTQPNLVVVLTGANYVQFPATHLRRVYATNPEAGPAQACILTGRYPHSCGVPRSGGALSSGIWCLPEGFRSAGYHTYYFGDWGLGGSPKKFGFMQDFPRNRPGIHLESPFYCHVDTGSESSEADLSLADRPNTILVTTSVHGPAGPGSAQEDSVHVPLSMRWTGGNPSYQDLDGLFSHVDLAPTLLGFCGLTPPPGLQGHDRSRYILHRDGMPPESVFAYGRLGTKEEWAMIVRGLDKLVVNHAMETTHLFNLGLDPSEQSNLAEDPAQERTRDELNAHLREWMRRIAYRMDPSGLRIRP